MADGHIQKHLHSMFQLLRSEETLKMAVKLESARYGRTRYLVVVSCSRKPTQRELASQQNLHLINAQIKNNNNNNNNRKSAFVQLNEQQQQQQQQQDQQQILSDNNNKPPSTMNYTNSSNNSNNNSNMNNNNNNSNNNNIPYLKSGTNNLITERNLTKNFNNNNKNNNANTKNINKLAATVKKQDNTDCANQVDNMNNLYEIEESCLLGIDCNEKTTVGLVLRILGDTTIRLDGDGGFSITGSGRTHIFKPVSVQAMWSALQTLHKVCAKARENKFFPGGPSHSWVSYYDERIDSDRSCLNEWYAMDSIESKRPPSPDAIRNKPSKLEDTEQIIKSALKEIIVQLDLDEVTSKYIRTRLEERLDMDLTEYKSYIDQEMLTILGQMDAPTKIFDHVYLGSEWNASNLEELQENGVRHILNVTREIDNFFPGMFEYFNVRVYDDEKTNLLKHWDNTYKYISQAQNEGSKVLVHCKMGVSRSASVVIAYAMKAYGWTFSQALNHVKTNRSCIKPNKNFLTQLETYQGMLLAMKNKEKLQRSKSDTNLRSTKDARLLPGSEPTPLIQAFKAAAKKLNAAAFENRPINYLTRSKSWSPDNVESAVLLPKQHSQSLENIPPERLNCKSRNNMRVPCVNGQNYSVSQNQVFHLEENNSLQQYLSSVKHIVNELESNQKRMSEINIVNKEQWDPGEKGSPEVLRKVSVENRASVKSLTTATVCDRKSPSKQLFNVNESPTSTLESESMKSKQIKFNTDLKSKINDETPVTSNIAITSSPTTTITAPSTSSTSTLVSSSTPISNSASSLTVSAIKTQIEQIDKNARDSEKSINATSNTISVAIPVWSRRSSYNAHNPSSRSTSSSSSSSSSKSFPRMSPELLNDFYKAGSKNVKNLRNSYSLREKNTISRTPNTRPDETKVALRNSPVIKFDKNNENESDQSLVNMAITRYMDQMLSNDFIKRMRTRCKSHEMIYENDIISSLSKRLSASSPAASTDKTFIGKPILNWTARASNKNSANLKNKRFKNRSTCGTVQNLKMTFEPNEGKLTTAKESKRGKSLPTSPVATANIPPNLANPEQSFLKLNYDKTGYEEISVKGLVDKYEVTKLKNVPNTSITTAAAAAINSSNNTSPIFSNTNPRLKRSQPQNKNTLSNDHSYIHTKPPPSPLQSAVKPSNILLANRMQQENSQAFARLKQQFSAPSAYNTM